MAYTAKDQDFWDKAYLAALPVFVAQKETHLDHENANHRDTFREGICIDAAAVATQSVKQRLSSMEGRKKDIKNGLK